MQQARRMIRVIGACVLGMFLIGFASVTHPHNASAAQGDIAPNFIVILTDDQDPSSVAYMPILQAELVEKGALFTNYYVTAPLCCPSRASLLTGQYPVSLVHRIGEKRITAHRDNKHNT